MNRMLRLPALALALLLVALPTLTAFAKEISSLTITGPNIKGEITLDDHNDMQGLMDAGLIDNSGAMAAPKQSLGMPYTITVNLDLGDRVIPFIRMDYYPMQAGQAGYIHTTGRLDQGETLRDVDEWSVMPLKADDLLRGILSKQGVELQPAVSVSAPAAANVPAVQPAAPAAAPMTAPWKVQLAYFSMIAAVGLLAGAGLLFRRRRAFTG